MDEIHVSIQSQNICVSRADVCTRTYISFGLITLQKTRAHLCLGTDDAMLTNSSQTATCYFGVLQETQPEPIARVDPIFDRISEQIDTAVSASQGRR